MVNIGEAFKIGGKGIGEPGTVYASLGQFISTFLPNLYILAGFILFVLFIGGGFAIITSGDNPEKLGKGNKALTSALIGFLIIFCSYWIIQIIEHITGVNILKNQLEYK